MIAPNARVRRHWDRLSQHGCIVTGSTQDVTIHHCHGGSMRERGFTRTFGRKTSDWLVIPLCARLHVGPYGIDGFPRPSVEEWEARYGKQADYLDRIVELFNVDVWKLARAEERGMAPRAA